MVSFAKMWEVVEKQKSQTSPLMNSGEELGYINVLRTGQQLHKEKQTSFWDEFVSLCSDSEGLAQLLGVKREQVKNWPAKIRDGLNELEQHKAMNPQDKEDTQLIPTGSNGAFTTNSDPLNMGELY